MTKEHDLLVAITSREQLEVVRRKYGLQYPGVSDSVPMLTTALYAATSLDHCVTNDTLWPLHRDALREQQKVYPAPTDVVKWMRTFKHVYQHFPHLSREDPLMIAYTPDAEAGIRDKKVRIAVGRFIRKFFPLFTDDAVRQLEAAHRAELDPSLEIATTFDEVANAYRTMAGDSGCMRHKADHFGHAQYHPSAIYASPNFGVAIHRDTRGTVKSRAVVWHNPQDESDKRYVRIYGDGALEAKLQRKGYTLRGLKGAKVLALQDENWAGDSDESDRFVVPYIDPAGGINYNGSKDSKYDARYAVRYDDDPQHLHLVTNDERLKLQQLGVNVVSCDSQSGSIRIPLSARAEIMVTCAVSLQRFSRLEHNAVRWMNADGTLAWANVEALDARTTSKQMGLPSGRMEQVYALPETFEGKCLPGAWGHMLDNPDTMRINRLVRLDPAHYPEDGESVYHQRECVQVGDSWIRTQDAYQVQEAVERGIVTRHIHKDAVRMLRKMGYVNSHPTGGMKLLVHSTDTRLVTTAGGKKALQGLHDLVQLWDGQWEFTRNAESIYIGGFAVLVKKGSAEHRKSALVPDAMINARVFNYAGDRDSTLADHATQRQFLRYFGRFLHKPEDKIVDASYGSSAVTMTTVLDAARDIVGMGSQQEIDGLHYSNVTLGWAKSVMRAAIISEERRLHGIESAEANALLYEVPQSEDGFDSSQRSHEDQLLDELDRVLAKPATQFMRTASSATVGTFGNYTMTSNATANWPVQTTVSMMQPAAIDDDLTF